jgi:hypothetical protein
MEKRRSGFTRIGHAQSILRSRLGAACISLSISGRNARGLRVAAGITETNRTQFAILGMQHMAFGPYLMTNDRDPRFSKGASSLRISEKIPFLAAQ